MMRGRIRSSRIGHLLLSGTLLAALVLFAAPAFAVQGDTVLVSQSATGGEANGGSDRSSISGDGRYVTFVSAADNVSTEDNNGQHDVFARDLFTNTNILVSRATDGTPADANSLEHEISADGRYVAFMSWADNLSDDDNNDFDNIFVRDLQSGTTTLVSVSNDLDGANGDSGRPSISADGRYVAFTSEATDLAPDPNGATRDVFVRDLQTGMTTLASVSTDVNGAADFSSRPSISADGRYVAFDSNATDLATDPNGATLDVFVRDLQTGTTTLASVDSDGGGADNGSLAPSISADGRYVAFESSANDISGADADSVTDVFVRDLGSSTTIFVSRATGGTAGNDDSRFPSISANGRYVAFESLADTLSTDDDDAQGNVFVRDLASNTTTYVSHASDGTPNNGSAERAAISADGGYVAFEADASNLDPIDMDFHSDVYRHTFLPSPPVNLTPPSITGTTPVGATLTCDPGTWTDGTLTYQWRRGATPIPTATASSYVVTTGDQGASLDCLVTATNADGQTSAASNTVAVPAAEPGPKDETPPDLALSGAKAQTLGKAVKVRATSGEDGELDATGKIKLKRKQEGKASAKDSYKLRPAAASAVAGEPTTLKLKVSKKARKAAAKVLRKGGKAKALVTVTAADEAGNATKRKRTIKLKLKNS